MRVPFSYTHSWHVYRFGVEQGTKADGSVKLRAIDHLSWSAPVEDGKHYVSRKRQREHSVNGCTAVPEKIHMDHLDALVAAMRAFREIFGEVPALWKADVDSAFRRIPLRPEHRWAAGVTYKVQGKVRASILRCSVALA